MNSDSDMDDQENSGTSTSLKTTQERKASYRNLLNKAEEIHEGNQCSLQTINAIGEILRDVNVLNNEVNLEQRVGNADETLLDCLVLSSASSLLKKCVAAVDVFTSTYEPAEFAEEVLAFTKSPKNPDTSDIMLLLDEARKVIPEIPAYSYVYGSYDFNQLPAPKQKKERLKVVKEKLTKKEPEKVTCLNKDEDSIEHIVSVLNEVLETAYVTNQERPINYYDYIIDTDSYSATIENMFYFSFLIRDGRAHMELDKKGLPVIKPVKRRQLAAFREDGGKNSQIVTNVTMDIWEKYKTVGLIQQRKKRMQCATGVTGSPVNVFLVG